jgi:hypothetical protein
VWRERLQVKSFDVDGIRYLALNKYKIVRPQIRLEMDERFNSSQGQRSRSINYRYATTVPTATVEASPFSAGCPGCVAAPAYSPEPH